ncbi:hypothetical protein llap_9915 [Limosa lapponica baueri]|uniref:Uncharacterized protein n=1 Tax=Limosa lapponica baueri TaxID=1758121 RepID=A0A2I0U1G1_LIMLA|nr:hypothetical protein llap_9915 [Limosa lapponica baueri]
MPDFHPAAENLPMPEVKHVLKRLGLSRERRDPGLEDSWSGSSMGSPTLLYNKAEVSFPVVNLFPVC